MTTLEGRSAPASAAEHRAFLPAVGSWARSQKAAITLVAAVILGQLSRLLFETLRRGEFMTSGRPPLLGVLGLAVALVWCGVIIWARLRMGRALNAWARGWVAGLGVADTMPRQYAIEDRGPRLARALCTVLDVILLLLMQNTVREPLLMVTGVSIPQARAEAVFVGVLVVLALLLMANLYATSKPVAAYLAWSVMDRLVPTAGFLAGGPVPAPARGKTGSQPPKSSAPKNVVTAPPESEAPPKLGPATVDETIPAPVPAPERGAYTSQEPTVVAEKTPAAPPSLADELTVRAPAPVVDDRTVVAEQPREPKGDPGEH